MRFKQLFQTAKKEIKKVLTPPEPVERVEKEEEEEVVACTIKPEKSSYTGIPAPAYLQEDSWFGPVPEYTEKQRDYMEMEFEMKKREQEERKETTKEPEDIHEIMYQMSQGNWNTVIESQGGSEHFHEGPGGWNSGTGMGQFR